MHWVKTMLKAILAFLAMLLALTSPAKALTVPYKDSINQIHEMSCFSLEHMITDGRQPYLNLP